MSSDASSSQRIHQATVEDENDINDTGSNVIEGDELVELLVQQMAEPSTSHTPALQTSLSWIHSPEFKGMMTEDEGDPNAILSHIDESSMRKMAKLLTRLSKLNGEERALEDKVIKIISAAGLFDVESDGFNLRKWAFFSLHSDKLDGLISQSRERGWTDPHSEEIINDLKNCVFQTLGQRLIKSDPEFVKYIVMKLQQRGKAAGNEYFSVNAGNPTAIRDRNPWEDEDLPSRKRKGPVFLLNSAEKARLHECHLSIQKIHDQIKFCLEQDGNWAKCRETDTFKALLNAEMVYNNELLRKERGQQGGNSGLLGCIPINDLAKLYALKLSGSTSGQFEREMLGLWKTYQLPDGWCRSPVTSSFNFPTQSEVEEMYDLDNSVDDIDMEDAEDSDSPVSKPIPVPKTTTTRNRDQKRHTNSKPGHNNIRTVARMDDIRSMVLHKRTNVTLNLSSKPVTIGNFQPNETSDGEPIVAWRRLTRESWDDSGVQTSNSCYSYVVQRSECAYEYRSEQECGGKRVSALLNRSLIPEIGANLETMPGGSNITRGNWGLDWVAMPPELPRMMGDNLPTIICSVWWSPENEAAVQRRVLFRSALHKKVYPKQVDAMIIRSCGGSGCKTLWEMLAMLNRQLVIPSLTPRLLTYPKTGMIIDENDNEYNDDDDDNKYDNDDDDNDDDDDCESGSVSLERGHRAESNSKEKGNDRDIYKKLKALKSLGSQLESASSRDRRKLLKELQSGLAKLKVY